MDELNLCLIEAEARIHRSLYACAWNVFSMSIAWAQLRKTMNYIEREHFRNSWEAA